MFHLQKGAPQVFKRAVETLKEIAPLKYAGVWDNVGLLIDTTKEKFEDANGKPSFRIFFTNDLTEMVVREAIEQRADLVVSYHPTPFGKFNKLVRETHTSRVLLSCLANGIAVYSPHTALDCVRGGVNDWLVEAFDVSNIVPCEPNKDEPDVGFGRAATLNKPMTLDECIAVVKSHVGLENVRLGKAHKRSEKGSENDDGKIRSIAVCAGSGGSVFKSMKGIRGVDLVISGEMSHHDALELQQNGTSVILTEHSNSERGFLPTLQQKMKVSFENKLQKDGVPLDNISYYISVVDEDPLIVV